MKPTKLSQTSNLSDEIMNPSEHFNNLKNENHSASFNELPGLMNSKQPTISKGWGSMYKVAATLLITGLTFIACSLPVQQEEEIGYMIKGVSTSSVNDIKSKAGAIAGLDLGQISINPILHEIIGEEAESLQEVVMILPEANLELAQEKKRTLSNLANFRSLEILPIEETVERPLYEAALKKVDLHVDNDLTDAQVTMRINTFIQANAKGNIEANLDLNEKGERIVKLYLDIKKNMPIDESTDVKRSLEELYNGVSKHRNVELKKNTSKEDLMKLKESEIKRKEDLQNKQKN